MSKPTSTTKRAKTEKVSKPNLTLPVLAPEAQVIDVARHVALNPSDPIATTVTSALSRAHQVLALVEAFTRQPYSRAKSLLLDMAILAAEEVQP